MSVTSERFAGGLVDTVPEASTLVEEHLADHDGLLLHLLMADVLRFAVAAWQRDDTELAGRILAFVEVALRDGDDQVQNAVCVSFVEHIGVGEGETPEFIASWPAALTAELQPQARR